MLRILLVDDDPDIRMLVGFVLGQAGHAVAFAETGAAGIDAARAQAFDLILLDYRLGDMSGADVYAALRVHETALPPVVMLTGDEDPAVARALLEAGAAGVIAKPFDPETLDTRVRAYAREARP